MNLITLDDKSDFDKLPDFEIQAGNFPKQIDPCQNGYLPFISTGNPTISGAFMVETFSEQRAQSIMDLSRSSEEFERVSKSVLNLPYVSVRTINTSDVLYKINELTSMGFLSFIIYTDNPTADESINFFQRIEAMSLDIGISVANSNQARFLMNNTILKIKNGFVIKTPHKYKDITKSDVLTTICKIKELSSLYPVIVEDSIFKPMDAVKALALGADAVILSDILASTDESVGGTIEREVMYRTYSMSGSGSITDCIQASGPAINILVEFETVLRDIMVINKSKNLSELAETYSHLDIKTFKMI
jgi:hypothetical protein